MMPAFSKAILASVSPRYCMWSKEMGISTLTRGRSITLVESSRPPRPVSSSRMSAGMPGEGEEGCAGGDLEEGDGLAAIRPLAFLQQGQQRLLADQRPGQPDALVEAHQMGRDIGMHAIARRLQHRPQIGDDRALAVGAGDMDDGRELELRMAEARKQAPGPVEGEVDDLGMQLGEPLQDAVGPGPLLYRVFGRGLTRVGAGHSSRRRGPRAGSPPPPAEWDGAAGR